MQAIILAAGMGKRLKDLTANSTKCMVKVNGETLIKRALTILDRKKLSRIVVVVGYEEKKLIEYIDSLNIDTEVCYVSNKDYAKTNNIYSLALAKEYLESEDTLLLESDIIFEESLIDKLLEDERATLALVDKFESWMDGTCMVLDKDDNIVEFIPGKYLKFNEKENYFKTVNIYKFSSHFSKYTYVPFLEAYQKAMGLNEYYESVIKMIAMLETKEIKAKRLEGDLWYEIDDVQDLDIAESLFAENGKGKYQLLAKRYGGYWRYPKLLDFCYLVNPYYPPTKMLDEIKSNFETLITQYPSGLDVNTLLASKCFGVKKDWITIGNGAAELINSLISVLEEMAEKKIGIIRPTFEEYPNRFKERKFEVFASNKEALKYDENDLINFCSEKDISMLVLVNPDNPSGNFISVDGIMKLIIWAKEKSIILVLDESFVDFATGDFETNSMLNNNVLDMYDNLYMVKSISKSYGVPGLRLGVMATKNTEVLNRVKKSISIWNINSFAEFYMQIAEKYKKDYVSALLKFKHAREIMFKELTTIKYLTVYPSEANFFMCELDEKMESIELCSSLLEQNIIIKDLTPKMKNGKQYIRIAIRTEDENRCVVDALRKLES